MHSPEHRLFSRVCFRGDARLSIDNQETSCKVLDLSLKGALLQPQDRLDLHIGEHCLLELILDDGAAVVRMEGDVAHAENGRIGLVCQEIDLDSITHLRRLLELNLGDAELLHREFSALIAD